MKNKKVVSEEVRRGFDIDLELYNRMRAEAIKRGEKTKAWLSMAIRNELRKLAKGV